MTARARTALRRCSCSAVAVHTDPVGARLPSRSRSLSLPSDCLALRHSGRACSSGPHAFKPVCPARCARMDSPLTYTSLSAPEREVTHAPPHASPSCRSSWSCEQQPRPGDTACELGRAPAAQRGCQRRTRRPRPGRWQQPSRSWAPYPSSPPPPQSAPADPLQRQLVLR